MFRMEIPNCELYYASMCEYTEKETILVQLSIFDYRKLANKL